MSEPSTPLSETELETMLGAAAGRLRARATPQGTGLSPAGQRILQMMNFIEAHKLLPRGPSLLFIDPATRSPVCHPVGEKLSVGRQSVAEDPQRGADLVIRVPRPAETGNFGRRQFTITQAPHGALVEQMSDKVPTFHNEDDQGLPPGEARPLLDGDCLMVVDVLFYFTRGHPME